MRIQVILEGDPEDFRGFANLLHEILADMEHSAAEGDMIVAMVEAIRTALES